MDHYTFIKFVNYLRHCVSINVDIHDGEQFESNHKLLEHMKEKGHFSSLPPAESWNKDKWLKSNSTEYDPLLTYSISPDSEEEEEKGKEEK